MNSTMKAKQSKKKAPLYDVVVTWNNMPETFLRVTVQLGDDYLILREENGATHGFHTQGIRFKMTPAEETQE